MKTEKLVQENSARAHHPYSASKLQYLEACPWFTGEDSTSEASEAGTRQHAAVESGTTDGLNDDDEVEAVQKCLDYLDQVRQTLSEEWGTFQELQEIYVGVDEKKVPGEGRSWKGTSGGFLDKAFVSADGKHARIIDWKFGKWKVEDVENNLQGFCYAVGLKRKFPKLEDVRVEFAQPYLDSIDSAVFTAADLEKHYLRILTVVSRAVTARKGFLNDKEQPRPAEGLCTFCGNRASCRPLQDLVLKVGKKFAPLKVPENLSPDHINDPREAQIGIQLADVVKKWAESYRRAATDHAVENREFIPDGYELKVVTKRQVLDVDKFQKSAEAFGVSPEEFHALLDVAIGDVEKLVMSKAPKGQKKIAKSKLDEAARGAGALDDGDTSVFLAMKRASAGEDSEE